MAKKLVLDVDDNSEYHMLGISCQLPDYRLIYFLNKALNINFKRISSFAQPLKEIEYSLYHFDDEDNFVSLYVISNRSKGIILFPEFSMMDYIFLANGEVQSEDLQKWNTSIRTITYVQISNILNTSKVKNYFSFIFEFEKHLQPAKTEL